MLWMEQDQDSEDSQRKPMENEADVFDQIAERRPPCLILQRREKGKQWRSSEKHDMWRQERQLKSRRELEDLIEEKLNRFRVHYIRDAVPTKLQDVSQFLMPKWTPTLELTSTAWLGDWRPSAILELVHGLVRSSSLSSSSSGTEETVQLLSQFIHEIRIEEAILDEEMAEIQATCILHLPFSPAASRAVPNDLASVQSQFGKIQRVIAKAQCLRFKVLETVLKKILRQTDAAEFLGVFEVIQRAVHQFAAENPLTRGPVSVSMKDLRSK